VKPTKEFKMKKQTKCMLALMPFKSSSERHAFKNAMIDAQLSAEKFARDSQRSGFKDSADK
jgi:hypothetical protein